MQLRFQVLLTVLFLALLNLQGQHCLQGYRYRVPINISLSAPLTATSDTSGIVAININAFPLVSSSKMQERCTDVRFTDYEGNSLPYWIDNSNEVTGYRTAWVQIDDLSIAGKTIYMFYGNSTAISESDPSIFDFFDHFEGSSLDPKWMECGSNISVSNGSVNIGSNSSIIYSDGQNRNYALHAFIKQEQETTAKKSIGQISIDNKGYALTYDPSDPASKKFETHLVDDNSSCPYLVSSIFSNNNDTPLGTWKLLWTDNRLYVDAPTMGGMDHALSLHSDITSTHCFAMVSGLGSMKIDWMMAYEQSGKTIKAEIQAEEELGVSTDITLNTNAPICNSDRLEIWTADIASATYTWKHNNSILSGEASNRLVINGATPDESGQYEVIVTLEGSGCWSKSDEIDITVDTFLVSGNISPDITLCKDNNSGVIELTDYSTNIEYWQIKEGDGIWLDQNTTEPVYPYTINSTHSFRAYVSSGECGSGFSSISTVTIEELSDGGSLSEDAIICYNSAQELSLSNQVGNVSKWQKHTESVGWNDITPTFTGSEYLSDNLLETTLFRTIVKNGICKPDTSNEVTITVNPTTVKGNILGSKIVCAGNMATDTLVLEGYTGNILQWEYAPTANGPWGIQSVKNDTFLYQGLNNTTFYRALVYSKGCDSLPSDAAEITVDQKPSAETVSGSAAKCAGVNNGFVTLDNYLGKVVAWQSSYDGSSWDTIYRSFDTLNYKNLTTNKWFRALVNSPNGVCNTVSSDKAKITVSEATEKGNIYPDTILTCIGNDMDTLRIRNYKGDILRWESSATGTSPWLTIDTQADSLIINGLLNTNHYRAIIKSGACDELIPDASFVRIDQESYGGITLGSTEVCEGSNEGKVNILGPVGNITKWEFYKNGPEWQTLPNTQSPEISYSDLLDTISYRAIVQNGVCPPDISSSTKITVNPLPDVAFTADAVNLGDATSFNNSSEIPGGFIQNWQWNFGNEESSSSKNPSYVYPNQGTYHVRLSATSNKGCIDSASQAVTVFGLPDVNFISENVCLYSTTTFINNSNGSNGVQYIWNFGDGNKDINNSDTVKHFFNNYGNYTVTLKAVSLLGGEDSIQKTISVYPRSVPDFSFENICQDQAAHFTNLTQSPTPYLNYEWFFHTGETDQRTDPKYTYTETGNIPVTLRVTTNNGCLDTLQKHITINPNPTADFWVTDVPYQQPSIFQNQSNIEFGTLNYKWQFGDENTSDTTHPVYFYEAPGVYQVGLTATSGKGCIGKISKAVKIFDLPVVKFSAANVCANDSMVFVNESTIPSGTLRFEWNFGDGSSSEEKAPTHLFSSAGIYTVRLISISNQGARDTVWNDVSVYELPYVAYTFNEACDGFTTVFENLSTVEDGNIASVLWDFGDGSNSVQLNPEKDFLNPGTYRVTLYVQSTTGCSSNFEEDVIVHQNPVADFDVLPVCHQFTSEFNNSSYIDDSERPYTLTYRWNFDDGQESDQLNPDHRYQKAGVYQVQLAVATDAGCNDTLYRLAEVYSLPDAFAGKDTTVERGFPIGLFATGGSFYEWSPVDGLSDPLSDSPDARPLETTTYQLRVTDNNQCTNFDTMTVFVEDVMKIIPANILTPNNNGENDTWNIVNIDAYPEAKITIFDRWGQVVYETRNYNNNWQGVNTNGDILPDGTYYYIIILSQELGVTYKGAITILRDK